MHLSFYLVLRLVDFFLTKKLVSNILPIDSNIVIADLPNSGPDAREFAAQLRRKNVTITVVGTRRIRIVTHMDVGQVNADALITAMATVI